MKHKFSGLNFLGAIALLALTVGCSSTQTQSKENLLIAAGFQVIAQKPLRSNRNSKHSRRAR